MLDYFRSFQDAIVSDRVQKLLFLSGDVSMVYALAALADENNQ